MQVTADAQHASAPKRQQCKEAEDMIQFHHKTTQKEVMAMLLAERYSHVAIQEIGRFNKNAAVFVRPSGLGICVGNDLIGAEWGEILVVGDDELSFMELKEFGDTYAPGPGGQKQLHPPATNAASPPTVRLLGKPPGARSTPQAMNVPVEGIESGKVVFRTLGRAGTVRPVDSRKDAQQPKEDGSAG